jgi:hypothetical protein
MEITDEELEKWGNHFINQQKIGEELNNKEKTYRSLTDRGELNLEINWQEKSIDVDVDFVKTKRGELLGLDNFEGNYEVVFFEIDKVLFACFDVDNEDVFPRNTLWDTDRNDRRLTMLISYIQEGKSLCPPIISCTNEALTIKDGNHRIALSRFIGLEKIPFIVSKKDLNFIKKKKWLNL